MTHVRGRTDKAAGASARKKAETPEQTAVGRQRLERVAALPGERIDTSDIPEVKGRAGWVRVHEQPEHPLHRVLSRLLSIRAPEPDIALAQRLAESKGLPYQTYIKSLLHQALERERALPDRSEAARIAVDAVPPPPSRR